MLARIFLSIVSCLDFANLQIRDSFQAWNMWQNDSAIELIDSTLEITTSSSSIPLRCIQIGLLCVQDNPSDRPDMSQVVGMLNNKDSTIALPQHPAFTVGRNMGKADICSVNGLTLTQVEARWTRLGFKSPITLFILYFTFNDTDIYHKHFNCYCKHLLKIEIIAKSQNIRKVIAKRTFF